MKVMDKASLASRNKLLRAQTERQILGLLDHPFLPTQYSYFETDKFYCLVMEFCSGGNLDSLWQKQPHKYFSEHAAQFVSFFHASFFSFLNLFVVFFIYICVLIFGFFYSFLCTHFFFNVLFYVNLKLNFRKALELYLCITPVIFLFLCILHVL